jgi:hypothetical protein
MGSRLPDVAGKCTNGLGRDDHVADGLKNEKVVPYQRWRIGNTKCKMSNQNDAMQVSIPLAVDVSEAQLNRWALSPVPLPPATPRLVRNNGFTGPTLAEIRKQQMRDHRAQTRANEQRWAPKRLDRCFDFVDAMHDGNEPVAMDVSE